jgi:hypothetical protein
MRYLVDLFGGRIPVTEVTLSAALDLALLDLDRGKVPRAELINSARVYQLDQEGKVIGVVRCELEEGNAA